MTRTLTTRKPRAVTAAIPNPAFHHTAESPISRPSCCKCLEHTHKAMYYKHNKSSHNVSPENRNAKQSNKEWIIFYYTYQLQYTTNQALIQSPLNVKHILPGLGNAKVNIKNEDKIHH